MDAATDLPWRPRKVRQSPLLLWGMGAAGQALARLLAAELAAGGAAPPRFRLFEPQQEPGRELREQIAQLAGEARGREAEFAISVLGAAWQMSEAEDIDWLSQISQIMATVLPGSQSLTLAVLLPPATADDEDKRRTFRCFLGLESLPGALPFLNTVFVYQMPVSLYPQPLAAGTETRDFLELLERPLIDAELAGISHRFGHPVVWNGQAVGGRKAAYSALGAQRLRYFRADTVAHLEARFQDALFRQGLDNADNVTPAERNDLTGDAQRLLAPCQSECERQFGALPPVMANLPGDAVGDTENRSAGAVFEEEFSAARQAVGKRLDPVFQSWETRFRNAFDTALSRSPSYLAGGACYLEALAAAVEERRETFCRRSLADTAIAFYAGRIAEQAATLSIALEIAPGGQDPAGAVRAAADAFRQAAAQVAAGRCSPPLFFALSWERLSTCLETTSTGAGDAWRLLTDCLYQFLTERGNLAGQLQDNRQRQDDVRADLANLRHKYPWHQRLLFGRGAYRREQEELQGRLAELGQERQWYEGCYGLLRRFFLELTDDILWPHLTRQLIIDGIRGRLSTVAKAFDDFRQAVGTACADRWRQAEPVRQEDCWTATSMADRETLDQLYQDAVATRPWLAWAQQALAFLPPGVREPGQTASYQDCQDLRDHYHAGPGPLLDRLGDFAAERFRPVRRRHVLELIETRGGDQAGEFLRRALDKAQYLPELSPGMIPLVEQQHRLQRVRVIRSAAPVLQGLRERYSYLFGVNDQFLDNGDAEEIDLTVFTFGFPGFLLHSLEEARRLALGGEAPVTDDLWPQTPAGRTRSV